MTQTTEKTFEATIEHDLTMTGGCAKASADAATGYDAGCGGSCVGTPLAGGAQAKGN